jgi:hypothetical protein
MDHVRFPVLSAISKTMKMLHVILVWKDVLNVITNKTTVCFVNQIIICMVQHALKFVMKDITGQMGEYAQNAHHPASHAQTSHSVCLVVITS